MVEMHACVWRECGLVCHVDWAGQTKEEEEAHEGLRLLMMMLGRKTEQARQGRQPHNPKPESSVINMLVSCKTVWWCL